MGGGGGSADFIFMRAGIFLIVTRPKYPPHRKMGVAMPLSNVFLWYRRLSLLRPPVHFVRMAYRNSKTGLGGGVSQKKLVSEAYRATGGIA